MKSVEVWRWKVRCTFVLQDLNNHVFGEIPTYIACTTYYYTVVVQVVNLSGAPRPSLGKWWIDPADAATYTGYRAYYRLLRYRSPLKVIATKLLVP